MVRLQPNLLSALDAYARDAEGQPSRPETVRRILQDWLETNGYLTIPPDMPEGVKPSLD